MEPNIPNESIVLIKKCDSIDLGEIGAFYYDGEVYCKRLLYKDGNSYLESINTKIFSYYVLSRKYIESVWKNHRCRKMTKELMRDLIFLARKLETATNGDLQVPQDLLDMLIANKDGCS